MAQAGTLDIGINVDPTGMIRGFGRSKQELQKFERGLTSATRSMSRGFTNLAVDFAVTGDVGVGAFKRLTQSAIGLAGVFGPAGMLVSAIGGTALTLWNFHTRAREEAERTREAYKDLLSNLSVPSAQRALEGFAESATGGQRIVQLQGEIAEATRQAQALADKGRDTGLAYGSLVRKITEARTELAPLLVIQQQWRNLVNDQIGLEERIGGATSAQAKAAKERLETERRIVREAERQLEIRQELFAAGPAFRGTVSQARVAEGASQAAAVANLNALTNVTAALTPTVEGAATAIQQMEQSAQEVANSLSSPFAQLKAGVDAVAAGMANLSAAVRAAAAAMTSAAAAMGQMIAGKIAGGSFLGQLLSVGGGAFGQAIGGPIGGAIGSIVGATVGRGLGAIGKGIGKLFGFGKKRGPSPEELAAQQLQKLAQATREATEAMRNIARGFKVSAFRYEAADARVPGAPPPRAGGGLPGEPGEGRERTAINGNVFYIGRVVANSPDEIYREAQRSGASTNRGGVRGYQLALTPGRA